MKAQNIMRSLVVAIILMAGFAQANAVEYQGSYKPSAISRQYSAVSYQAVSSAVGFQSTSAYAAPEWAEEPMLNADGTVNEGAYMGGRSDAPAYGPRRDPVAPGSGNGPGTPGTPVTENEQPLGDAALPLTLLACAYAIYKVSRRRKEA